VRGLAQKLAPSSEVLSEPDEDGQLAVRFGLMKLTVSLAEIESLDGKKADLPVKQKSATGARSDRKTGAQKASSQKAEPLPTVRTDRNTLDLRGSRVADAEIEVDRAISKLAGSTGAVWIIHGKGTGKLRQGIQDYLDGHALVSSHELAPQKEAAGGAGVTVAYLTPTGT